MFASLRSLLTVGCAALVSLVLLATSGCSEPPTPTGTVKGTVTLDGEPYSDAEVMFLSLQSGQGSSGQIQSDGSFTLADPLPVGTYQVYLAPKAPAETDQPQPVSIDETVPEKYWSESTTDIIAEIKEGENTVAVELAK